MRLLIVVYVEKKKDIPRAWWSSYFGIQQEFTLVIIFCQMTHVIVLILIQSDLFPRKSFSNLDLRYSRECGKPTQWTYLFDPLRM